MDYTFGDRAAVDQEPIRLPGSPFWNVFKRFGRDEMIALLVNVSATLALGFFTSSAILLAFAGPVIEKVGFFPAHIWEGVQGYRHAPHHERAPWHRYAKDALKGGSVSLMEDLLLHDPLYVVLFLLLSLYPGVPLWIISSMSFIIAVVGVAWIEVAWTEARYSALKKRLLAAGMSVDEYREARFYIRSGTKPETVVAKLQEGFGMRTIESLTYRDRYFVCRLPRFSGRAPILRLRQRTAGKSSERYNHLEHVAKTGFMQSLQLVYIRPQEESSGRLEQFRFFSVRKDKFYFPLDMEMPERMEGIGNPKLLKLLRAGAERKRVEFERTILLDETKALYAGVDWKDDGEGCIIELKIRKELPLFLSAMRFVMRELPVTHTTMQKTELQLF